MKDTYIIIRYGEVWLKQGKRSFFEKVLVNNIRACLYSCNHLHENIVRKGGRIIVASQSTCPLLSKVSGIVSFSFGIRTESSLESLKRAIEKEFLASIKEPFRIRVHRLEKTGPTSVEIERELGAFVVHMTGKKVNLENPETTLGVDWYSKEAYIFINEEKGIGGLPIVLEGKVALILQTERDLAAGKMLMKRGCLPDVVVRDDFLFNELKEWCPGILLKVITENLDSYDFIVSGEHKADDSRIYLPLEGLET